MICALVRKNPRDLSQTRITLRGSLIEAIQLICIHEVNRFFFFPFDGDHFLVWSTYFFSCGLIHGFSFVDYLVVISAKCVSSLLHLNFLHVSINHIFLSFFSPLDLSLAFPMLFCHFKAIFFSFLKSFIFIISFLILWPTKISINALSVYFKNQLTLTS